MADEKAEASAEKSANKGKMKMLVMVGGLLVGEAAAIIVAFMFMTKEPAMSVGGLPDLSPEQMAMEKIVEVLVLDDRMENAKTGATYVYPTEIYAHVRQKHEALLQAELSLAADLEAEVRSIWRQSDPSWFHEMKLETLRGKVRAMLNDRLGPDPETGESILQKVVIVMGTGYRADS